jgi:hypothetical protein
MVGKKGFGCSCDLSGMVPEDGTASNGVILAPGFTAFVLWAFCASGHYT